MPDMILAACGLAAVAIMLLGWSLWDASRPDWMLPIAGIAMVALMLVVLWGVVSQSRGRHAAEDRLQAIADSLPGTVYVLRRTPENAFSFEFLSTNAGETLGIDREHVLRDANAARQALVEEDRHLLIAAAIHSAEHLTGLEVDFRIRKPDGTLHWVRSSGIPVPQANGDVLWNGYWSDITENKATEQALRDALQRLDEALSVAGLGDWTCDLATGALTWSPQVYRMLHLDPALGTPDLAEAVALFEDGARLTADAFFKAQETGEPQTYDLTYPRPDADAARFQVIVVSKVDESGIVRGMHGTIQDISGRMALEEGLSQAKDTADIANRAKTVFLATMSHEIRTHLNGMLGILEVIFMTPLNPDLQGALEGVRESGKSLQQIIDDILDFSKVEAGKLDIRPEATSIADLVAGVQRVHAGNASSVGLELRHSVDPDIRPAVMVDGLRLRQILGNFVSNAIKFTTSGHVEIRALLLGREGAREHVRFQVQDTGIGISPEQQQRLFQPFEQADAHTATRFGGTGLGLSISRRLAELMGGEVSMASAPGEGTIMTLDLPLAVADPALLAPERVGGENPATRLPQDRKVPTTTQAASDGTLVLVVDDHPVNRMVMRSQLNVLGYAVEEVESGAEALEQWHTGRFGLVLTDCNMPFMSGYQLSQRIREAEVDCGRRRTPIVACSANVIGGVYEECRSAGMDDYVPKPTELVVLAEVMDRWLPLKKAPSPGVAAQGTRDEAARASPSPDDPAPLAVSGGSPVDSPQVLKHFRRVNDADVVLLRQAVQSSDLDAITHLAHRVKGACGFIGATGLATASGTLEDAARTGDAKPIERLMEEFESELERLYAYLDAEQPR